MYGLSAGTSAAENARFMTGLPRTFSLRPPVEYRTEIGPLGGHSGVLSRFRRYKSGAHRDPHGHTVLMTSSMDVTTQTSQRQRKDYSELTTHVAMSDNLPKSPSIKTSSVAVVAGTAAGGVVAGRKDSISTASDQRTLPPENLEPGRQITREPIASRIKPTPDLTKLRLLNEDSKGTEEDGSEYSQATVWWFTSTAFPIMAGTFGPIANLFSVCALVQSWRVQISTGDRVKGPTWLVVLNVISLFSALIANIALLLNFAHRIRYPIAQFLTITLWYLSCIFLFLPIFSMFRRLLDTSTQMLTQSFWYGLISGALYFVVATLLLMNVLGAYKYRAYPPTFRALSISQRTLMLQTISFSLYLALNAGVFSAIEGWAFLDALYWADYTLLTIGLGSDFVLTRTLGRMLVMPFSAFGILLLGLIVGSVRGLVLERAKVKVLKRRLGRQRERWRKYIDQRRQEWIENQRAQHGAAQPSQDVSGGLEGRGCSSLWRRILTRALLGRAEKTLTRTHWATNLFDGAREHGPWMRDEFELMRHLEARAEQIERYTIFGVAFFAFLLVWIGGSLIFWACEHKKQGWTYPESLYFSYTSITTIGYGDFFPTSAAGRPFFVVWSLIAIPTITVLISSMGDTIVKVVAEGTVWLGRYTILPEKEVWEDLEKEGHVLFGKRFHRTKTLRKKRRYWKKKEGTTPSDKELPDKGDDHASVASFEAKLQVANRAKIKESDIQRMQKRWLAAKLAREIVKLAKDVGSRPEKRYTWDQWMRWFALLEEPDAENGEIQRVNDRKADNAPVGDSHCGNDSKNGTPKRSNDRQLSMEDRDRSDQGYDTGWAWTWLSDNGPLFSQESESEWVIGKLTNRLEEILEDELQEDDTSPQS